MKLSVSLSHPWRRQVLLLCFVLPLQFPSQTALSPQILLSSSLSHSDHPHQRHLLLHSKAEFTRKRLISHQKDYIEKNCPSHGYRSIILIAEILNGSDRKVIFDRYGERCFETEFEDNDLQGYKPSHQHYVQSNEDISMTVLEIYEHNQLSCFLNIIIMGVIKTLFFVTAPMTALTVLAFRLGHKLPLASRLFGNYIGLSYIYFKSLLKMVKPVDQVPFEVISLARKTSQQSQALRRELKSTFKRVQEDVKARRQQTFKEMSGEGVEFGQEGGEEVWRGEAGKGLDSGSSLMLGMMRRRGQLLRVKAQKKKSSRFYQSL